MCKRRLLLVVACVPLLLPGAYLISTGPVIRFGTRPVANAVVDDLSWSYVGPCMWAAQRSDACARVIQGYWGLWGVQVDFDLLGDSD